MTSASSGAHPHGGKRPHLLPREGRFVSIEDSGSTIRKKQERGRKNVSRACQECRQRRIRCDTNRPCQPCQANNLQCIDDVGPDGIDLRTIRLGQNSHRSLLRQKALLDDLFHMIRTGNAETVLAHIEAGLSPGDIAAMVDSGAGSPKTARGSEDASGLSDTTDGASPSTSSAENWYRLVPAQPGAQEGQPQKFGNMPLVSSIRTNCFPPNIQGRQMYNLSKPLWECVPLINDEASAADPFSRSCYSFWNLAKQQMAAGAPAELILSSDGIDMDLLFRDRTPDDPHTVSTWSCELLKTFGFLPLVVKMAATHTCASLMRWLIAPTKENYLALPEIARPIDCQLFIPHSIGVDVLYLPEIRESLLTRSNRDWVGNVTPTTLKYNWPYSEEACFDHVSAGRNRQGTARLLSRAFVEHIGNPANICVDRRMLQVFPEFDGLINFYDPSPLIPADDGDVAGPAAFVDDLCNDET